MGVFFSLGYYVSFPGYKSSDNADNVTELKANIPLACIRHYSYSESTICLFAYVWETKLESPVVTKNWQFGRFDHDYLKILI